MKRTDHLSRAQRSALMSKIRSKNTKPELAVRKMVASLGHGFRLHRLPGLVVEIRDYSLNADDEE